MAKKNDIANVETATIQPVEQIESLIITVRGRQVILDRDLARLYGVETKRLNQQVQRNIERFPEDFMFQLSKEEFESLRSQFATSFFDRVGELKLLADLLFWQAFLQKLEQAHEGYSVVVSPRGDVIIHNYNFPETVIYAP